MHLRWANVRSDMKRTLECGRGRKDEATSKKIVEYRDGAHGYKQLLARRDSSVGVLFGRCHDSSGTGCFRSSPSARTSIDLLPPGGPMWLRHHELVDPQWRPCGGLN